MSLDKINVLNDPRVERRVAYLNRRRYGYLYGQPEKTYLATVFLVHGFPDLSIGWRYQIPFLLKMGLRVVAPDMMGYGITEAPPYKLQDYTFRTASDDLAELARQLGCQNIILGGHDWGGAITYRFALYYPHLVSHVITVCTPYFPPSPIYKPFRTLLSPTGPTASFTYQEQLASGTLEESTSSKAEIRNFLNVVFSPWGEGKAFNPKIGIDLTLTAKQPPNPLLNEEEMKYYISEYARNGTHGPLNWYRTRELNYLDELQYFFGNDASSNSSEGKKRESPKILQPTLFIYATGDITIVRGMTGRMEGEIPRLEIREVDGSHWVHLERAEEVNGLMGEFIERNVFGKGESKL